jgi:hypothetical protein
VTQGVDPEFKLLHQKERKKEGRKGRKEGQEEEKKPQSSFLNFLPPLGPASVKVSSTPRS